jgi:molybdopterin-binding protein
VDNSRAALGVTPEILRAEGLFRRLGGRVVVDIDHLGVHRGEILAVLGPNGAGKSTLFRMLLLLETPDRGAVYFEGRAVGPGDRAARRGLAGVFQRPHLFSGSVAANVALGLHDRGLTRAERASRVATALRVFGLDHLASSDVRTLSGGEAQRVAVARALAVEPEVLLLDEPTAGLDIPVRRSLREDLERAVRVRAGAVVLVTHDPADAFALANRIAVMEAGRIVQIGTPEDLVLEPTTPFVAAFTGADLLLDGAVDAVEGGLVRMRTANGTAVWGVSADLAPSDGDSVHASYRPEDITLVAAEAAAPTSAINRFRVRVSSAITTGALVRVRLEGELALTALITRRSAEALEVHAGSALEAHLKATAVRVYRIANPR